MSKSWIAPTREEILECLREAKVPLTPADVAGRLQVPAQHFEAMNRRLIAMERDGQLLPNRKGVLLLASKLDLIAGRIQGHRDGFGFLLADQGGADIFLAQREMQKAMHGDRALVKRTGYDSRGRPEGIIIEVTERAHRKLVGRFLNERGVAIVVPEDKRIKHDILIPPGEVHRAQPGQVVTVEITDPPSGHAAPMGRIVEVLGDIDDPGMEIEIAVRKFDVPSEFSEAALAQALKLPDKVRGSDGKNRVDLRDVALVTIDGADARDFDDAVYCEPLGEPGKRNGGFRLLVAIADVSHYVKPGDALDSDAAQRSTSVYFPRRVIPMLPEKLSNGLCSLNPAVDRLVLVCDMVVTAKGQIKAYQFFEAVMHSAARLSYDEVWGILSGRDMQAVKKRAALIEPLQNLYDLFRLLAKAREQRGAIDFDTVETQIVCDAAGRIERIVPRSRNDAHKLIEECMLSANVCAADFLRRSKHAGLFRIHEGPTPEKLQALRDFLRTVGLSLGGAEHPTPADYAELSIKIRARPDANLLQTMMLRSMQQAVYSPDNVGHFGLAYEAYTHFTSPIRRYPDLLTHRCIKALLVGSRYTPTPLSSDVEATAGLRMNRTRSGKQTEAAAAKSAAAAAKSAANTAKQLAATAKHSANVAAKPMMHQSQEHARWAQYGIVCSANERRADEASRDVEAWLKCQYVRERIGEQFAGRITGVASFGIFVTLNDLFVDGLVHVSELGGEYFQFNEAAMELRGERTGMRYRLTDELHVQVSRVDLEARRIEFRLVPKLSLGAEAASKPLAGGLDAAPKVHKAAPAKDDRAGDRARAARELRSAARKSGKGRGAGEPRALPAKVRRSVKGAAAAAPSRGSKRHRKGK